MPLLGTPAADFSLKMLVKAYLPPVTNKDVNLDVRTMVSPIS